MEKVERIMNLKYYQTKVESLFLNEEQGNYMMLLRVGRSIYLMRLMQRRGEGGVARRLMIGRWVDF